MAYAETRKAKSKLKVLSSSLDELEAAIEPLLSGEQTLPGILLALEPIQQAKLQTVLPYLVYDLVFIYLRSRGIDPKSHPVIGELDRVRQYFDKIKNAENPAVRTNQVDKAAASRFIKHAISQAQIDADAAGVAYPPKASTSVSVADTSTSERVPVKVTSKMLERAEWQKRVNEAGSDEEEELEGWEDNDVEMGSDIKKTTVVETTIDVKGKGKAVENPQGEEDGKSGGKRRRPAMDPFAASGYDIDSDQPSESHPTKKQALSPDASSKSDPSNSTTTTPTIKPVIKTRKSKRVKQSSKDDVSQLLVNVAASQGSTVSLTENNGEDNDVDMAPTAGASPSLAGAAGDKKKNPERKTKKAKGK